MQIYKPSLPIIKRLDGFTLIELIIVLVILGIITLVISFSFPSGDTYAYAQAQQLANDLRYMQNLAVTRESPVRINFAASQYSLTETDGTTAINHPGSNSNVILMPTSVTLSTINLPNNYVVFGSNGEPYSSTSISSSALTGYAWVLITGQSHIAVVLMTPETGAILNPIIF